MPLPRIRDDKLGRPSQSPLTWRYGAGSTRRSTARVVYLCFAVFVVQALRRLGGSVDCQALRRALALRYDLFGSPPSTIVGFSGAPRSIPQLLGSSRAEFALSDEQKHYFGNIADRSNKLQDLFGTLYANVKHKEALPPLCKWTLAHQERYHRLLRSGKGPRSMSTVLIAVNLVNAEGMLPSMITALVDLASRLGPRRVHVLVYENGSQDSTPSWLLLLARFLDAVGASYTIYSSEEASQPPPGRRIPYLAGLRNRLLEPLLDPRVSRTFAGFDQVLFLNDVVFCAADAMEVLHQRLEREADMACGVDYKELRIKEFEPDYPMLFYDTWVARDMLGLPFYEIKQPGGHWQLPSELFPLNPASQRAFKSLEPVQVYSCWNGLTSMTASAFLPPYNIRFRASVANDDSQSECYLLCSDMWKKGLGKILIAPKARVAYDVIGYERVRKDNTTETIEERDSSTGTAKWEAMEDKGKLLWKQWPPKRVASYSYAYWHEERWVLPY